MPDDLEDLDEAVRQRIDEHRGLLRDMLNYVGDNASVRLSWSATTLDGHPVGSSTLERARRNLDQATARLDQAHRNLAGIALRPPQNCAGPPPQVQLPSPAVEPARSLWERLADTEEAAPSSKPATPSPLAATEPERQERRWAPYAVFAGAVGIVLALLGWALYSVR